MQIQVDRSSGFSCQRAVVVALPAHTVQAPMVNNMEKSYFATCGHGTGQLWPATTPQVW